VNRSLLGSFCPGIDEHPRNAYEDSSVCGGVITGDAEVEIRLGVSIQPYLLAAKGSSGEGRLCNDRAAYQDGRIDPYVASCGDMKRREQLLTWRCDGVHSDALDNEGFTLRYHSDRHLLAGLTRGKIDDLTGVKRLAHLHTSWCHTLEATLGFLLLRRRASSLIACLLPSIIPRIEAGRHGFLRCRDLIDLRYLAYLGVRIPRR
jgi:hypothetical protein